jgi:hypothetical protein
MAAMDPLMLLRAKVSTVPDINMFTVRFTG